jgi:cytochrome P450
VFRPAPLTAPGPTGSQLLRQIKTIQRNPLDFLLDSALTYGGVVQFPIGPVPVYAVSDPEAVKHVLQDNHRNYTKDTLQFNTLSLVTGDGLLTSDGDFWLRQRRMMQPAFHRQRIHSFGQAMTAAAERMLARWDALPQGTVLDVDAEMMKMTLEIVGHTLFSADLSAKASSLVQAVLIALDYIVYRAQTPLALPLAVPTPRNRAFTHAVRMLDDAVAHLIAERRAHPNEAEDDLLDMLLQARTEDEEPMSDRQLRDEIITLIIAGHETVASALTWTWHLLAHHPHATEKLVTELDESLPGRAPSPGDVTQLPYTRAVFDEALRLYPPAWLITRKSLAPDTLAGHRVPGDALIIISPYVIHRQPALWPEPTAFQPERFLREGETPRFAYLPFGGGPRLCIGNTFALMEGALVLATVAQRYHLSLAPGHTVTADALVTIRPHGGLPMRLQRRTPLS